MLLLTPYDESIIKISMMLGLSPHYVEGEIPSKWINKMTEYIKKYGNPSEQLINQLATLSFILGKANGLKNVDMSDFLPSEWKTLIETNKWKHYKKTMGFDQNDVKVANNYIKLLNMKMPLPTGVSKNDAIDAIEKVYQMNHNFKRD